jgi:hypothetical protein
VIGTDCIGSCKFKYHTITAKTAPKEEGRIIISFVISRSIFSDLKICRFSGILYDERVTKSIKYSAWLKEYEDTKGDIEEC